jgi:hypothetical protein
MPMTPLADMTVRSFRVPTTDPYYYPYAIVTKRRKSARDDGFELHFLDGGMKADWEAHVQVLRESDEFEWVAFTTANFWIDESGTPMGGGLASRGPSSLT